MRKKNEELEESVNDVKEGVEKIELLSQETILIVTKEGVHLEIAFTENGYSFNQENFETLHNLLMKKSKSYQLYFQTTLYSKLLEKKN